MDHYIAYHNEAKMGRPVWEKKEFGFLTDKFGDRLVGAKIWAVSGKGASPKRYVLSGYFVANRVEEASQQGYRYRASGNGVRCVLEPVLNDCEWFSDLFRRLARFSLGLQPLKDQRVIDALEALCQG